MTPERRRLLIGIILAVTMLLVLSACAPGGNPSVDTPNPEGDVAGFWLGLWHGIIAPVTFVISLFTDNVNFYEIHNNGNWYDFGFVLGAGILFGGGGAGARYRS
jgi:hypothetical protein